MAKKSTYTARIEKLAEKLGSRRAVARALGVSIGTVNYRIVNPESVRAEHLLALDGLEATL
jgi:hypothetical protein